jgi:hypothetical protein
MRQNIVQQYGCMKVARGAKVGVANLIGRRGRRVVGDHVGAGALVALLGSAEAAHAERLPQAEHLLPPAGRLGRAPLVVVAAERGGRAGGEAGAAVLQRQDPALGEELVGGHHGVAAHRELEVDVLLLAPQAHRPVLHRRLDGEVAGEGDARVQRRHRLLRPAAEPRRAVRAVHVDARHQAASLVVVGVGVGVD